MPSRLRYNRSWMLVFWNIEKIFNSVISTSRLPKSPQNPTQSPPFRTVEKEARFHDPIRPQMSNVPKPLCTNRHEGLPFDQWEVETLYWHWLAQLSEIMHAFMNQLHKKPCEGEAAQTRCWFFGKNPLKPSATSLRASSIDIFLPDHMTSFDEVTDLTSIAVCP